MESNLICFAVRIDRRHGPDAVAVAVAELGEDAPAPLIRSCIRSRIKDARKLAARREYHERRAGFARGIETRDVRLFELEPVEIDPLRYLDCLAGIVREVVSAVIAGEPQTAIAVRLGVSQPTVSRAFSEGIAEIREFHGIAE